MARLEARQRSPRAQEGVLDGVLGVLHRSEHPVAVGLELAAERLDEVAEGVLAASAGRLQQLSFAGASGCRGGGHPDQGNAPGSERLGQPEGREDARTGRS